MPLVTRPLKATSYLAAEAAYPVSNRAAPKAAAISLEKMDIVSSPTTLNYPRYAEHFTTDDRSPLDLCGDSPTIEFISALHGMN